MGFARAKQDGWTRIGPWGVALCLLASASYATGVEERERIASVTLYPGSALVERELRVQPGTHWVEFACLPWAADPQSFQLHGEAGIKLGAIDDQVVDHLTAPACAQATDNERIRLLEDQRAEVEAESSADDLALNYLKSSSSASPIAETAKKPLAADVQALDIMRRYARDAYARQYRQRRSMEALDRELTPLRAERDRNTGANTRWRMVRAAVSAERGGVVALSYRVPGAGWTPTYRAALETSTTSLTLERMAKIAQRTGEDWKGVRLRLSTVAPNGSPDGPTPQPWRVDVVPGVSLPGIDLHAKSVAPAPAAAPALAAARVASPASAAQDPLPLDISWAQEAYATTFSLSTPIDLKSNGQDITVSLSQQTLPVQLTTRTAPRLDASAYLIARAPHQTGAWPAGMVQLMRDGAHVGSVRFTQADDALTLPFGKDDQVLVSAERRRDFGATSGFLDKRNERQLGWTYTVRNTHTWAIQVQVLEDTPVSGDEVIQVKSTLTPSPDLIDWEKRAGVVGWTETLAAGATSKYQANYVISYPKDAHVVGLR